MVDPTSAGTQTGPLSGVVVLDLSRVLAGPFAGQLLGDLGAEIIKIERPGSGDDTRSWGPPFLKAKDGQQGDAAYYLAANRNKQSVAIDMAHTEGADLIRRLARRSHIVIENFKTGGLANYGLDFETLSKINPALVYCSITGFGHTGPYAKRAGYDYMIQAMGGLMSITGEPDGHPMKVGVAVADLVTGLYGTIGILAALRHSERTGQGQHIDMALFDCQAAILSNQATNFMASGKAPPRMGNAHPNIVPYQVFATADGHIVLAVGNDGQFHHFCTLAGLEGLADDARFSSNAARVTHRAALIPILAEAMTKRTTADWIAGLEKAGVPCGPIHTIDQVFADPQAIARGLTSTMTRADGGVVSTPACPIRLSATPVTTRLAPPLMGQDTQAVLTGVLGLTLDEIDALKRSGAIENDTQITGG